jgi:hypothetical protein
LLKLGRLYNISLENPEEIANAFNNYYIKITTKLNNKASMMLNNLKLDDIEPIVTIPVSEVEVRSIIKSIKSKGTSGYEGISSKILKQCASTVIKPLTYICNLSLTIGTFLERCKPAIVTPIYKKGNHSEMTCILTTNYLEGPRKSYAQQIVSAHCLKQVVNSLQFGFQKNVRIEDAIFFLLDNILTPLDHHKRVGGIFCDLTKAFDCVNHDILLHKLQYYGVRGNSLSWFKSYLAKKKRSRRFAYQLTFLIRKHPLAGKR